ncbi:MAG TPA: glycosyltransferase family 87 protein [Candidatus Limnocylindria bacterium]|nr:glycosyltransferase family 87 protein [Candidatus Limnocylindria bacterium]
MQAERRADLAYLGGLTLGILCIVILGPLERRIELVHINDFSGVWAGARAVVLGIDAYDPARWRDATIAFGTQVPDTAVYGYVPWVSLALLPFGFLPVEVAGWIWMFLTVAAGALGLRALLRAYLPGRTVEHGVFGLALLVTQPGFHTLVLGQWAFLLLGAVSAGVLALRADRPVRAGLLSLAFLLKPQLFVFTALRFFTHRGVAIVAIAAGAAVVVVSTALFPHWIGAWLSDVGPVRIVRSASLPVALSDLLGPAGTIAGYGLILLGCVVATRFGMRGDASLAVWLALSSAGAIYTWSYDDLLLLVPIVIAASVLLARRGPARARSFALGAVGVLFVVSPLLYTLAVVRHRESFTAVVPVALFVAIVVRLWPYRKPA